MISTVPRGNGSGRWHRLSPPPRQGQPRQRQL